MKKKNTAGVIICNIYILVWLLYNFHWNNVGMFFPMIDRFSNLFLAVNLVLSGYFTFVVLSKYPNNPLFSKMNFLIVLFVLYGLFSVVQGSHITKVNTGTSIKSGTYLIAALRSFLPIYTYFLFTKLGYVTEKMIKIWFWFFLAETILIYMSYRLVLGLDEEDEMMTNNRGYLFVYLFPFVYFFRKKPLLQYFIATLFLFFALSSLKRGAILITLLAFIFMFWKQISNTSNSRKVLAVVFLIVLVHYGIGVVERMYENSIVFQHRVETTMAGGVSQRDVIAKNLMDIYLNSNFFHVIFGFGADGTLRYGNYAHNDWLEMLFDQGILGLVAFTAFWVTFFHIWRSEERKKTDLAFLLGLLFICNFTKTLFSMWYSMANTFITLPLGYCLAQIFNSKKELLQSK